MYATAPHAMRPDRREWWMDRITGYLTTSKRRAEVRSYQINLEEWLASGETLSSVTQQNVSGPSVTSCTVSGTTLSVTMTLTGSMVARIVTSASRTIEVPLRWVPADGPGVVDAYV